MPDFHNYTYIPLDEAIEYFNNYLKKVDPLKDTLFLLSLTSFIGANVYSDIIDNLTPCQYTIKARRYDKDYRLEFYKNPCNTPSLTLYQIEELQKFNNLLKSKEVNNSLNRYYRRNMKIFLVVILSFIFIYTWRKFIR